MAIGIQHDVLSSAIGGDPHALRLVVTSLKPHVERQLARYPVTDDDRQDLLQTTLLQVVRRIGSFRGDANLSTWLFRVTANEALMMMRSQRRQRARVVTGLDLEELGSLSVANDHDAGVDGGLAARDGEERVRRAVAELPEVDRAVVVAYYDGDLGLSEIAAELSLTESAVRSRLHRARLRLQAILDCARDRPSQGSACSPRPRRRRPARVAA